MSWKRRVRPGDYLMVDDRSGFTIRASRSRREWTGAIVEDGKWEPEHPQDSLPAFRDEQAVREARPEHTPAFVGALTTTLGAAASAGATVITLETSARMLAGDRIGINLDSKDMFRTTIQNIVSDTDITISARLPGPASEGNQVTDWTAAAEQGVS